MLVLSRKINEAVIIDKHIKMVVLAVQGQQVRLGFEAPEAIEIHRQEVFDRIQQQKNTDISMESRSKTTDKNE